MIRRSLLMLALAAATPASAQIESMTQKPIVKAVREGDEEKVRQALLKGENPNQNDSSGRPLLMIAVMDGQVAVVQTLLKGGAVADATDRDSYTSLLRAAEKGDVDIADLLLKRNAKVRLIRDGAVVVDNTELSSLKRFKDDASEVREGFECGLTVNGYNDIKIGDIVESFELREKPRN